MIIVEEGPGPTNQHYWYLINVNNTVYRWCIWQKKVPNSE